LNAVRTHTSTTHTNRSAGSGPGVDADATGSLDGPAATVGPDPAGAAGSHTVGTGTSAVPDHGSAGSGAGPAATGHTGHTGRPAGLGAAGTDTGTGARGVSHEARNLQWLLENFVEEVPGIRSVAVVSSDGLLLLSSHPDPVPLPAPSGPARVSEVRMDLAAVVSGLASLTTGAAKLMDGGKVRQTTVAMADGTLFVMSISDGSLLGVHATAECDLSVIAYHMALFVGRAGHVLTPALRGELRKALEATR
jgi:hypothetical protein